MVTKQINNPDPSGTPAVLKPDPDPQEMVQAPQIDEHPINTAVPNNQSTPSADPNGSLGVGNIQDTLNSSSQNTLNDVVQNFETPQVQASQTPLSLDESQSPQIPDTGGLLTDNGEEIAQPPSSQNVVQDSVNPMDVMVSGDVGVGEDVVTNSTTAPSGGVQELGPDMPATEAMGAVPAVAAATVDSTQPVPGQSAVSTDGTVVQNQVTMDSATPPMSPARQSQTAASAPVQAVANDEVVHNKPVESAPSPDQPLPPPQDKQALKKQAESMIKELDQDTKAMKQARGPEPKPPKPKGGNNKTAKMVLIVAFLFLLGLGSFAGVRLVTMRQDTRSSADEACVKQCVSEVESGWWQCNYCNELNVGDEECIKQEIACREKAVNRVGIDVSDYPAPIDGASDGDRRAWFNWGQAQENNPKPHDISCGTACGMGAVCCVPPPDLKCGDECDNDGNCPDRNVCSDAGSDSGKICQVAECKDRDDCTCTAPSPTPEPSATPTPAPECGSTCTNDNECPDGHTCSEVGPSNLSESICQIDECADSEDCTCAAPSPTPTPEPSPTPEPLACMEIQPQDLDVKLSQRQLFTCKSEPLDAAEYSQFQFRVNQGDWLEMDSNQGDLNTAYLTVIEPGSYTVRCAVCRGSGAGSECSDWTVL